MKNILSKILMPILLIAAISCNPDYKSNFGYNPFVQVTSNKVSKSENAGGATVNYQYVGPTLKQDLTVNLEVTLTGANTGITLPPTTAVIKAGEFSGSSNVGVVNDFDFVGDRKITVKILSTSSPDVVAATTGTTKNQSEVTIVEDDCPFDINDYVGDYVLDMNLEFGFLYAAGDYPDNAVTLAAGANPNTLVDPDFGFISGTGRPAVPVTIQLDPSAATASIVGSAFNFLDGSSDANAVVAYNSAPSRRVFVNKQVGQLATCSKTITIDAYIRREDGSIGQHLIMTYVKQ